MILKCYEIFFFSDSVRIAAHLFKGFMKTPHLAKGQVPLRFLFDLPSIKDASDKGKELARDVLSILPQTIALLQIGNRTQVLEITELSPRLRGGRHLPHEDEIASSLRSQSLELNLLQTLRRELMNEREEIAFLDPESNTDIHPNASVILQVERKHPNGMKKELRLSLEKIEGLSFLELFSRHKALALRRAIGDLVRTSEL